MSAMPCCLLKVLLLLLLLDPHPLRLWLAAADVAPVRWPQLAADLARDLSPWHVSHACSWSSPCFEILITAADLPLLRSGNRQLLSLNLSSRTRIFR